jgi:DNA-binding transcriptional regulator YhcF (GntR family)
MLWKFTGNKPVYMQIMEQIRAAILAGEFLPGSRIPPVREFAAQAQVNPNTMQRALLELEREGLLMADGTVGRFVTQDAAVLDDMRKTATDTIIRAAAAQFRAIGLSMQQAALLLAQLEEEEENG